MIARPRLSFLVLLGSLVTLGTGVQPAALLGQASQITAIEAERRLEYRAATAAYESALGARAAAESRFSRLTQEIAGARASGDEDRRNQALGEVQRLTVEMLSLDQRVEDTAQSLRAARMALLDVLDAHLELLGTQIQFAPTSTDSTELVAMALDIRNQWAEVNADGRGSVTLVPVVMPEVTAEPRDGPVELRVKAELLEKRATQADSLIVDLDREVADLERRAQRDRGLRDLMTSIGRFGDTNVPVGAAGSDAETRRDRELLTAEQLESDLESLRLLRERYVAYREEARRRARQFLLLAGDIT